MNRDHWRIPLAAIGLLLLIWGAGYLYFERRNAALENEARERAQLLSEYRALADTWSAAAQKRTLAKLEKTLTLYHVAFETKKGRHQKIYTFRLARNEADRILKKILDLKLRLQSFSARKADASHLEIEVGVAP